MELQSRVQFPVQDRTPLRKNTFSLNRTDKIEETRLLKIAKRDLGETLMRRLDERD